jgi:hypothetical protein
MLYRPESVDHLTITPKPQNPKTPKPQNPIYIDCEM